MSQQELEPEIISETENFAIWRSLEEGEYTYHVELGGISLHLAADEYEELIFLFQETD